MKTAYIKTFNIRNLAEIPHVDNAHGARVIKIERVSGPGDSEVWEATYEMPEPEPVVMPITPLPDGWEVTHKTPVVREWVEDAVHLLTNEQIERVAAFINERML